MIFSRLRAPPEVFPLIGIVSFAATLLAFSSIRAGIKYPDVSWDRKHNPHPWMRVKPKEQVKFYSNFDYEELETVERPKV